MLIDLFFNDFDTAAVEHCKIYEINYGILVKVNTATPIRLTTTYLKLMRRKSTRILRAVSDYPDCVCAIELLAVRK